MARTHAWRCSRDAVSVLKRGGARVYLDAGNARWTSAEEMAGRLRRAAVGDADGFALNVSNFIPTPESVRYGERISALVGGKHFIIDTSRNGAGGNGEWCNPRGRALGALPTTRTGNVLVDAFLWVKQPGRIGRHLQWRAEGWQMVAGIRARARQKPAVRARCGVALSSVKTAPARR